MIKIWQTQFGDGNGNCFQACVASILELTLNEVPHFCRDYGKDWVWQTGKWLQKWGLNIIKH